MRSTNAGQPPVEPHFDGPSAGPAIGLLAAFTVLRIVVLFYNGTDLFVDEAQYWAWSRELGTGYFSKPPLIAWVIRAATELCGHGEVCVRLPSPLIHFASGWMIYLAARRLYGPACGFWSVVACITAPGLAVSAGIISTDVLLIFFCAAALLAFAAFLDNQRWSAALALGACIGFGLLSKYAMAYFLGCAVLYLLMTDRHRWVLLDVRFFAAIAVAGLIVLPNVLWNLQNGSVTVTHTADNARWDDAQFSVLEALEFLGAQFAVLGPILFGAFVVIALRAVRQTPPDTDRLLLFLSVPIVLLITGQAFISSAQANWAAAGYVPAIILVSAVWIRDRQKMWRGLSVGINAAAAGAAMLAAIAAGTFALPGNRDPFARWLGWEEASAGVGRVLDDAAAAGEPYATLLTARRTISAELPYYLRDRFDRSELVHRAWVDTPAPEDHFELTRPFGAQDREPILLVMAHADVDAFRRRFKTVEFLGSVTAEAGLTRTRAFYLFRLSGYDATGGGR